MTAGSTQPVLFNPFDPAFRADPYPTYRRLREEDPVQRSPIGVLVLSRYEDIVTVLRHPHASSDQRKSARFAEETRRLGLDPDEVLREQTQPFLFLDPPDHTRLRGLVNKAFTPRVVENLRPRIRERVDDLLDAAAPRGTMDVVEDLAYPLPVTIICEMLGVPPEDHVKFREWSRETAKSLDPEETLTKEELERRQQRIGEFVEYFGGLIAKRRAEPRDDLISALIAAEDEGSKLSENELLVTCILLLVAGHETTVNLIGNGMLALLRHRDQLELLAADPSLIRTAVEELLRFDPPVQLTMRLALADIALTGTTLPAGEQAVTLLGSANRDPAQFAEPERLNIRREDNRHLSFGMGIHFCLGAPLARVEGQIAIGQFVGRMRRLELATDAPRYKETLTLRGLEELPVRFDA